MTYAQTWVAPLRRKLGLLAFAGLLSLPGCASWLDGGEGPAPSQTTDAGRETGSSQTTDAVACAQGRKRCGDECVLYTDPAFGCSLESCAACPSLGGVATCTAAGRCGVASCAVDRADCDNQSANGCETDLRSDVAHCGACSDACVGPSSGGGVALCEEGGCKIRCNAGYRLTADQRDCTPIVVPVCGNRLRDEGESCDDGNASGNDGCSASCQVEPLYVCTGTGPGSCVRAPSLWAEQTYVKASNADAQDWFGYSVALSGDGNTLAVGAYYEASSAKGIGGDQSLNDSIETGAVYVFRRAAGTWAQEAYLKASNAARWDRFGYSVALNADGSTLAVGAHTEASAATGVNGPQNDNTRFDAGAVYVFRRAGVTWSQEAYLKASNPDRDDRFGEALTLSADGDTLAVGVALEDSAATGVGGNSMDNSAADSGAVYIFRRSGANWAQEAYVKASNTEAEDHFGVSVALSGDGSTLAVGASQEDSSATAVGGSQADNNAADSGAVYLFKRTGSSWTQDAYVKASNTRFSALFGLSVALSVDGSTLAVGSVRESSPSSGVGASQSPSGSSAYASGAAYVFRKLGSAWAQEAYIKASNPDDADWFGNAVALNGDGSTLAVGAMWEEAAAFQAGGNQMDNSASRAGAAYIFRRSGVTWAQEAYVKAKNAGQGDEFAHALALSADGRTLAVGANYESSSARGVGGNAADDSAEAAGAAYLVYR